MLADDHDRPSDPAPPPGVGRSPRDRARAAAQGFDRLVRSERSRRVSPRRLGLGVLAAGAVAWGLYEGARFTSARLAAWVAAQPEHQVRFAAITLDPAPPPFIRRGAEVILGETQIAGQYPELVSVLALDAEQLRRDLARSPWIERVGAVRRSHGRLTVAVTYRQPLALIAWAGDEPNQDRCVPIDRQGVEMPCGHNDFIWDHPENPPIPRGVDPLIQIRGLGAGRPDGTGHVWEPTDGKLPPGTVAQAVALAQFLRNHHLAGPAATEPARRLMQIEWDRQLRRFKLITPQRKVIIWGAGPGSEAPDEPTAAEKWAMLERFSATKGGSLQLGANQYLVLQHPEARVCLFGDRTRDRPIERTYR